MTVGRSGEDQGQEPHFIHQLPREEGKAFTTASSAAFWRALSSRLPPALPSAQAQAAWPKECAERYDYFVNKLLEYTENMNYLGSYYKVGIQNKVNICHEQRCENWSTGSWKYWPCGNRNTSITSSPPTTWEHVIFYFSSHLGLKWFKWSCVPLFVLLPRYV